MVRPVVLVREGGAGYGAVMRRFWMWISKVFEGRRFAAPSGGARADAGRHGEVLAAEHLEARGYAILCRNWRHGRHEIDIVARSPEGVLVFVEVRARDADARVSGYWSVDARKRRALRKAVCFYLRGLSQPPALWRMDIVEIRLGEGERETLVHFTGVTLGKRRKRSVVGV